jgi:hypothetical protein
VTVLPTVEQSASAILAIFKARGCRPGDVLQSGQLNMEFFKDKRHRAADFTEGLKHAEEKKWLEAGPNFDIRLTKAGFDAM